MPINRTKPSDILNTMRRRRTLELRVSGLSYRDILQQLKNEFGSEIPAYWDERNVSKDVKFEIIKSTKEIGEIAVVIKRIDTERMDQLFMVMFNKALTGDTKATQMCLKIMDQKSKLLGLYAPTQVNVSDWRSEILRLYREKKVNYDQLVRELGVDLAREVIESSGNPELESGESQEVDAEFRDISEDIPDEGEVAG